MGGRPAGRSDAYGWTADRHAPRYANTRRREAAERSLDEREARRQESMAAAVVFWDPGAA